MHVNDRAYLRSFDEALALAMDRAGRRLAERLQVEIATVWAQGPSEPDDWYAWQLERTKGNAPA